MQGVWPVWRAWWLRKRRPQRKATSRRAGQGSPGLRSSDVQPVAGHPTVDSRAFGDQRSPAWALNLWSASVSPGNLLASQGSPSHGKQSSDHRHPSLFVTCQTLSVR